MAKIPTLYSTRKFGGRTYKLAYVANSREGADLMKLRYKRAGLRVRVVPLTGKHLKIGHKPWKVYVS